MRESERRYSDHAPSERNPLSRARDRLRAFLPGGPALNYRSDSPLCGSRSNSFDATYATSFSYAASAVAQAKLWADAATVAVLIWGCEDVQSAADDSTNWTGTHTDLFD